MTFEKYVATLESLEGQLVLEETLYALQVLLCGFENIYHKMGRLPVASECCFLTEKGELRAWINPKSTLNEFSEDKDILTG